MQTTPATATTPSHVLMTRDQWAATPRDLRFYSRSAKQRFLMQHTSRGIYLLAVTITR